MEIKKNTAKKLIKSNKASHDGFTVSNGYVWAIINRYDLQRTDHVKLDRTLATRGSELGYEPKF